MKYAKPEVRPAGNALDWVQDPQNKAIPLLVDSLHEQSSINAYAADE
ncbi:MAG: hypothetical protein WBQ34_07330 [Candidatus Acidiferrales bacterium]